MSKDAESLALLLAVVPSNKHWGETVVPMIDAELRKERERCAAQAVIWLKFNVNYEDEDDLIQDCDNLRAAILDGKGDPSPISGDRLLFRAFEAGMDFGSAVPDAPDWDEWSTLLAHEAPKDESIANMPDAKNRPGREGEMFRSSVDEWRDDKPMSTREREIWNGKVILSPLD